MEYKNDIARRTYENPDDIKICVKLAVLYDAMQILRSCVSSSYDVSFDAITTSLYQAYYQGITGHFVVSVGFTSSYEMYLVQVYIYIINY